MKKIKYIIPILMTLFFVRNIYLSKTQQMDSWMGGGMRMFAEIDKSLNRIVFVNIIDKNDQVHAINLNEIEKFKNLNMSLRVLPNEKKSKILQKRILSDFNDFFDLKKEDISSIVISVNKLSYNKSSLIIKEIWRYEEQIK